MDPLPPPSRPRRRLPGLASLLAAAALGPAIAGCGGGATTQPTTTSRTVTSTPTSTATEQGTTTTTTTTVSLPGTGRPTVTIGDKNYAEQFVLGQLYLKALEAQGFKVNITQNIGPPSVVLGSLKEHHLAMYPEYLNVVDGTLAHDRHSFKTLNARTPPALGSSAKGFGCLRRRRSATRPASRSPTRTRPTTICTASPTC